MSLYPTLEDMAVDKLMTAQHKNMQNYQQHQASAGIPAFTQNPYPELNNAAVPTSTNAVMYPNLADFMGLELSQHMIAENMPEYLQSNQQIAVPNTGVTRLSGMIAPLSGSSVGLQRAHVTNGIRELTLCKGADNKVGLRVKDINKGIFVSIVVKDSPAAMAGLRFGDQVS